MASDALVRSQLAAAVEAFLSTMSAPVVRLFTDIIAPSPDTDWLALTEPTGSWYAEAAVTYGEVFQHDDGSIEVRCASIQFNYSGTDAPETIRGYYVVDPGSPDVPYHGGNLAEAKVMGGTLDSVIVEPGFVVPPVLFSL